ncbi:hypothetical protein [Micromonospora sp. NPDC048830]|uniref:hypothetical protein n=1 Tax=Micromonospora sp. NPDC048830 TaxID=3364257 RepID=UPI003720DF32
MKTASGDNCPDDDRLRTARVFRKPRSGVMVRSAAVPSVTATVCSGPSLSR